MNELSQSWIKEDGTKKLREKLLRFALQGAFLMKIF
jgi:hypothetical protein